MSDVDSDEAHAPTPNVDNETLRDIIQNEMRSCMMSTLSQVLAPKRPLLPEEDFNTDLSKDDLIEIRGKRNKKSKNIDSFPKSTIRDANISALLGGHRTSNILGVPCGTTSKGVLSGTKHLGVHRGTNYPSAPIHDSLADDVVFSNDDNTSDFVDEYVLDLDEDEDDLTQSFELDAPSSSRDSILDPLGEEMFSPLNIKHPRSYEWFPHDHVSKFITKWLRNPLERETRNLLRAECSRPSIEGKVCQPPTLTQS